MSAVVVFVEVPRFYAEIERAQDPASRDRPVIVGGDPRKRGTVQSATLDALASGVEIGMTLLQALERCPRARLATNLRCASSIGADRSRRHSSRR